MINGPRAGRAQEEELLAAAGDHLQVLSARLALLRARQQGKREERYEPLQQHLLVLPQLAVPELGRAAQQPQQVRQRQVARQRAGRRQRLEAHVVTRHRLARRQRRQPVAILVHRHALGVRQPRQRAQQQRGGLALSLCAAG